MRDKKKTGPGEYENHFSDSKVELHDDQCQGLPGEAKMLGCRAL